MVLTSKQSNKNIVSSNEFQETKRLLSLIRTLRWQLTSINKDIKEDLVTFCDSKIIPRTVSELFTAAIDAGIGLTHTWIGGRINSAHKTSTLLAQADIALTRLNHYPDNGKRYAKIISLLYFDGNQKPTMERLAAELGTSLPTCRKYLQAATELYSDILWLSPGETRNELHALCEDVFPSAPLQ